jgi:hypothetical protein
MSNHRGRGRTADIPLIVGPKTPRLICSAIGLEGSGKTDFLKTAPRPLYVAYTDPNTEDVLGNLDDVYGKSLRMPAFKLRADDEDEIRDRAGEMIDDLREFFMDVIEDRADPPARTLALDTGTEAWDTVLMADFGRTMRINPRDRGPANQLWRDLFRAVKNVDGLNFIVTHRVKQKWGTKEVRGRGGSSASQDVPLPGEYERLGHKETGNLVNVEVYLSHDPEAGDTIEEQFGIKIVRCTQRPILIGEERMGLVGRQGRRAASFPWLASKVFPETTYTDWT